MNLSDWLSIIGAGAGALGSIVTAFSLNGVIRELDFARQCIEVTMECVVNNARNVPVFTGLDDRLRRAANSSKVLLWIGVALLVVGWAMQGYVVYAARAGTSE